MSATEAVNYSGESLMKISDVIARTTLGRTSIYRKIDAGEFPAPITISPKTVRWLKSDIDKWFAGLRNGAA